MTETIKPSMTTRYKIDGVDYEHATTDPLEVYKWLAETMVYRHKGSKDIKQIKHIEKYDGANHMRFTVTNGTIVDVVIPRS